MKINVKVRPHSSREEVLKVDDEYVVRVRATQHEGKANEAVIKLLSKHFKVPKTAIVIVTGATGRNKIVEIREGP